MFTNNHTKRYRIFRDEESGKIVAVASFAGKAVRGIAKPNPTDVDNPEIGEKLAILRCAKKINTKRLANAEKKLAKAKAELEIAQAHYDQMVRYCKDADEETVEIDNEMEKLMNSIQ